MAVAIVDDDPAAAKVTRMAVEDAGLDGWIYERDPALFGSPKDDAIQKIGDRIIGEASAAVCDNRLRPKGFAQFDGAELVAHLIRQKFPAVLISQFVDQDYDVSIRYWRAMLPSVMTRDEFRADTFKEALEACRREIEGEVTPQRRRHRVLIKIVDIQDEANQPVVDAIVPSWSRGTAVRFPLSIVPHELVSSVHPDNHLIAQVNLGATRPEDLFFEKFEAPPTPEDALFDHL